MAGIVRIAIELANRATMLRAKSTRAVRPAGVVGTVCHTAARAYPRPQSEPPPVRDAPQ